MLYLCLRSLQIYEEFLKRKRNQQNFCGNPPLGDSLSGRFGLFKNIYIVYFFKKIHYFIVR